MDDQPNQVPSRPEHSDSESLERIKFMFRRHSRQLLGLILVCVVGGIIYYVATKEKEPKSAGAWRSKLGGPTEGPDNSPAGSSPINPGTDDTDNAPTYSPYDPPPPLEKPKATESRGGETIDDYLSTASSSELLEELLRLRTQNTGSMPVNFVTVQRRSKIAKHLLASASATEEQKLFATNDYVEAIIQLDAINQSGKLNAAHVRDELIQIRDDYSGHADDSVGAKASLVYVLIPVHDFFASKDEATLKESAAQFETHADKIMRHPDTTARFAKLIVDIYRNSDYADAQRETATRILNRLEKAKDKDPQLKVIATLLREQIYFAKSELGSLVDRIEGGNTIARDDVQSLFEGLDANPSSRVEIYIVATRVIAEYARLGHNEDADALINWLVSINEKNTVEAVRERISQEISDFQKTRAQ